MPDTNDSVEVGVVIHDADRHLILLDDSSGVTTLPLLHFDEPHPPMDHRLADAVHRRTGLRTMLLEPLDFEVTVMLVLGDAAEHRLPRGLRWAGLAELDATGGFARAWVRRAVDRRPPWFRPGWLPRAEAYVDDQVHGRGDKRTGPLEQVRHWSMSTVWRAPTSGGDVYLKAVVPALQREPVVTRMVARRDAALVPHVLATDPAAGWWLTADFGTDTDVAERTRAAGVTALAGLQKAFAGHEDEMIAAGCRWLPLELVAEQIAGLLDRSDLWRAPSSRRNRERGLSDEDRDRLAAAGPYLARCCERLAAEPVPLSLVHGDFHAGNVIWRDGAPLLTDWSFAAVSSPLFDLAAWLHDSTEEAGQAALDRYAEAWADTVDPAVLRRAWRIAKPVAGALEVLKFATLADIVGPDYDFNWLPMTYSWVRRMLNAVDDPEAVTVGWRK